MCVFPTDFLRTHSYTLSKVRRNSPQDYFSLKINTPFLIIQHGGIDACGGMAEKFPPLPPFPPHVVFIPSRLQLIVLPPIERDKTIVPKVGKDYLFPLARLWVWQSIWQLFISVTPPLLQAVTWSASISESFQILVRLAPLDIAQCGQLETPCASA